MKKLLLIGLLALFPSLAQAQCNGIFAPNTVCGNNTGVARTPFQINSSSALAGPGTTVVNDLALWNNTSGTLLKDQAPAAFTKTDDTNVTITLGGNPASALVNAMSVTMGWSGTLAAARLNANVVQAITNDTNVIGSISAQNLTLGWAGTLAAARLNSNVVQAFTNDTNIQASISAQNATLAWAGQLAISRGGTGASTQSAAASAILPTPVQTGDILYWNGSQWTTLAGNNSGTQFLSENSSGLPSWVTVSGTGTVTSITGQAGIVVSASSNPITTSGTLSADGNYSGWALGNCTLATSVASNLLTVALKDNTGADPSATSPCNINYRNATATTGSTTLVAQTSALSISTFGTGATLGSSNNTAFRFWVVAFNNSGTNVLALYNASNSTSCKTINESLVQTSVSISGSATLAQTYYTPNGTTVTSKAIRILGYIEYNSTGLVTAGTYASSPNFIQVFGPGIVKPCEPVQTLYTTTTTNGTGSSGTFAALTTGLTFAITPTSAANLIRVETQGGCNNTGTGTSRFQMSRGTTANTNLFGTTALTSPTSAATTCSMLGFDFPNTTASTTYAIQGKTTATSYAYPVSGDTAVMTITEIMG